jgi:hypothetical protein
MPVLRGAAGRLTPKLDSGSLGARRTAFGSGMYSLVALVASHCVFVLSSGLGTASVAGVVVLAFLLSARAFWATLSLQPFVAHQTPALAGDPPGHARARLSGHIWLRVGTSTTGLYARTFELRRREQTYTHPHAQAVGIIR